MTSAEIRVTSPQRVVLLGAGRVAEPVLKLLAQHENVHITVASDNETQARNLMSCIHPSKTSYRQLIMPRDNDKIDALVKDSDVVISLLPATMHIPVAKAAINRGRNLVTASYVSEDMRQLNDAAVNAGVILMNEVGLDPGIDHMLIMKAVDSIHERGGVVEELISLCGGLPDPVAADNPLRYKFSWSPRGVLNASGNAATHLLNGVVEHIEGKDLLKSAKPSTRFPTMRLEAYPNRDSLYYRDFYNVPNVHTICRGTLRYEGMTFSYKNLSIFLL
jgi:saccharopine dehydrogenase-like NADP-dependent oxidoreductase